jgi:ribosomal protein L11 methyltransferase
VSDLAQVHFRVPEGAAEAVANLLVELGGGGVEQRDAETIDAASAGQVEFVTWLPSSDVENSVRSVEQLLASLSNMGIGADSKLTWHQEDAKPDVWVDAYKRHFKTSHIAKRFVIKPSWEEYSPDSGELLIELDPGMAFGTGLHASTKLCMSCLERISRLCPAPQSILDLGCGTGILAIAAARLWQGCKIVAIDNDPTAVEVCRENAERNGVGKRIEIQQGTAAELSGRYGLILANLSYDVLSTAGEGLIKHLDDFGRIVLSGLLAKQAQQLCIDLTKDLALEPEYTEEDNGWRALLLRVRT